MLTPLGQHFVEFLRSPEFARAAQQYSASDYVLVRGDLRIIMRGYMLVDELEAIAAEFRRVNTAWLVFQDATNT